jgi:TolB protein
LAATNDPFKRLDFIQWSADDRFIVFVQGLNYITRLWEIYRMDADGKNVQQISDGTGVSYAPQLSPDGGRIVFSKGLAQDGDLFIMQANGNGVRQLTQTQANERLPIWSPDGTHILFQTYIDPTLPRALEIMNADGTGRRRLADDSAFNALPSWSPDGQHIVYEVQRDDGTELYLVDTAGTQTRLLLKNTWKTRLIPSWQP